MKKIDRQKVYEKYGGHCAYCGTEIAFKDMQVDHVIPKRRAFEYEYDDVYSFHKHRDINEIDNLMPSCLICNHYKRSYIPENYREIMKTLHKRIEKIYIVRVAIRYGMLSLKPFDGKFYFETIKND